MSGEAGGGYRYPDSEDEAVRLTRHADHDPSLTCRPAFGFGLCEVPETAVEYPEGIERSERG